MIPKRALESAIRPCGALAFELADEMVQTIDAAIKFAAAQAGRGMI